MGLLGVDVGGTFTDFYYWHEGRLEVHKRPSTPADPAESVIAGIEEMGWRPEEVVHGSTVATNAVLERRGARTAFITTRGFRDLLTIGRQTRPRLYELEPRRPPPIVPPELCFEVDERIGSSGEVVRPLAKKSLARVVKAVEASGAEAVAICLLFSFLNPDHERSVAAALRAAGVDVSVSHEVLPEMREYERASTTALNAFVAPVVRRYLRALEAGLERVGSPLLRVIQSSGGTATAAQAASLPSTTLVSGPAGGVAGAFSLAGSAGIDRVITLDMGGTSTDVSLCPGRIPFTTEWSVSDLPVRLPSVDVHTVGAGGGSVAWLDEGGALRVGPRSAGAEPGPACFGKGGPPTVTDAHVVLGRLGAASFLGGRFQVSPEASRTALGGLTGNASSTARGVVAVANAHMQRALRVVSVERGFDPREFTLVAFGGAGPLHACDLAAGLSIRRVLVPRYPGVLSAFGMAFADATRDVSTAAVTAVPLEDEALASLDAGLRQEFEELKGRLRQQLGPHFELEPSLDMRYGGQGYELTVDYPAGGLRAALAAFHLEHQQRFGHADAARPVEVVVLRARGRVRRPTPALEPLPQAGPDPSAALIGHRSVAFDRERDTPIFEREKLLAGNRILGPALVAQMDSTALVSPGWTARVDESGNLLMEEEA
jgi:N-methylhydantoinase A